MEENPWEGLNRQWAVTPVKEEEEEEEEEQHQKKMMVINFYSAKCRVSEIYLYGTDNDEDVRKRMKH